MEQLEIIFRLIFYLSQHGHLFQRVAPSSYNLNEETCIKFVREIIKALNFIHDRRIIHLDLKPQNIMMRSGEKEESRVRLGVLRLTI